MCTESRAHKAPKESPLSPCVWVVKQEGNVARAVDLLGRVLGKVKVDVIARGNNLFCSLFFRSICSGKALFPPFASPKVVVEGFLSSGSICLIRTAHPAHKYY